MGQICSTGEEPLRPGAFAGVETSDPSSSSNAGDHRPHLHHHPSSSSSSHIQQGQDCPGGATPRSSPSPMSSHPPTGGGGSGDRQATTAATDMEDRLLRYRREQAELARRESIVNVASRSMVPVSSSPSYHRQNEQQHPNQGQNRLHGPINTYYDPAYAASAAQDILRSAAMTGGMILDVDDAATREAWDVRPMGTMPSLATSAAEAEVEAGGGAVALASDVGPSHSSRGGGKGATLDMLSRGRWDGIRLVTGSSRVSSSSYLRRYGGDGDRPEYYLDDLAEAFLEGMVPTRTSLFGGCPPIVENLP